MDAEVDILICQEAKNYDTLASELLLEHSSLRLPHTVPQAITARSLSVMGQTFLMSHRPVAISLTEPRSVSE